MAGGWAVSGCPMVVSHGSMNPTSGQLPTAARPHQDVSGEPCDDRTVARAGDHLVGGPRDRQVFYLSDWEGTRLAAERMGRTADEFCGWPLAYRPETPGSPARNLDRR
jgi:hypothetical protein